MYELFRESERNGWNTRAGGYGSATARATLQSIPAVLAHGQLTFGARVLDEGCGPGYVAGCAAILGCQAEGIDFAPRMVQEARTAFPDLKFEQGDVEALPFEDETFDAVLSNIVLFHVTRPDVAMAEANRVLSKGGRFVFSQWHGPAQSPCYKMIFEGLSAHADMSLADPAPNAYVLADQEAVTDLMQAAGFVDIRFETVENVLTADHNSFYDFFMEFGVRVPLILERQPRDVRAAVKAELDERALAFKEGGTYRIPMPSLVVSGRKPKG